MNALSAQWWTVILLANVARRYAKEGELIAARDILEYTQVCLN